MLHCLKTETEPASKTLCFLKKLDDRQGPKKKIVSINISRALFSLFDLLTFDDGIDRLSQNIGAELPLYTV